MEHSVKYGKVFRTPVNPKSSSIHIWRIVGAVVSVILALLLIANFIRSTSNSSEFLSFRSFLEWLGTVDSMSINMNDFVFTISGDWGILDFLRQFFNVLAIAVGVVVWLCRNLVNTLYFIAQFFTFIFVGV